MRQATAPIGIRLRDSDPTAAEQQFAINRSNKEGSLASNNSSSRSENGERVVSVIDETHKTGNYNSGISGAASVHWDPAASAAGTFAAGDNDSLSASIDGASGVVADTGMIHLVESPLSAGTESRGSRSSARLSQAAEDTGIMRRQNDPPAHPPQTITLSRETIVAISQSSSSPFLGNSSSAFNNKPAVAGQEDPWSQDPQLLFLRLAP